MRLIDKKNALDSVEFLQNYSVSNNIQSISDSISNLLEIQMKTLMLTSSSNDYIFKIIDYPIVSDYKYEPNRVLLCILGTILGGILSGSSGCLILMASIKSFNFLSCCNFMCSWRQ